VTAARWVAKLTLACSTPSSLPSARRDPVRAGGAGHALDGQDQTDGAGRRGAGATVGARRWIGVSGHADLGVEGTARDAGSRNIPIPPRGSKARRWHRGRAAVSRCGGARTPGAGSRPRVGHPQLRAQHVPGEDQVTPDGVDRLGRPGDTDRRAGEVEPELHAVGVELESPSWTSVSPKLWARRSSTRPAAAGRRKPFSACIGRPDAGSDGALAVGHDRSTRGRKDDLLAVPEGLHGGEVAVALPHEGADEARQQRVEPGGHQPIPTRSTTKTRVSSGPITPPAPRSP
jgi:hypothetical protein